MKKKLKKWMGAMLFTMALPAMGQQHPYQNPE